MDLSLQGTPSQLCRFQGAIGNCQYKEPAVGGLETNSPNKLRENLPRHRLQRSLDGHVCCHTELNKRNDVIWFGEVSHVWNLGQTHLFAADDLVNSKPAEVWSGCISASRNRKINGKHLCLRQIQEFEQYRVNDDGSFTGSLYDLVQPVGWNIQFQLVDLESSRNPSNCGHLDRHWVVCCGIPAARQLLAHLTCEVLPGEAEDQAAGSEADTCQLHQVLSCHLGRRTIAWDDKSLSSETCSHSCVFLSSVRSE